MPAPIRLGIIGISGYGGVHFRFALEEVGRGRARLEAATVINQTAVPERCAQLKEIGCLLFEDFRAMLHALRGRLDLCLIPTAIGWHAPMTIAALEAGANVLVEKPLAGSLADADRIVAAEQRAAGRFVAVGFQNLYAASTHRLKNRLLRNEIGELKRVRLKASWPRGRNYYRRVSWAGKLQSDGVFVNDSPLNNALAHYLMLALFLAGPTPSEAARAALIDSELYRVNPIESFDTAALRARLSTGVELFCVVTHACGENKDPEIILEGDRGTARWMFHGSATVTGRDGAGASEAVAASVEAQQEMFKQAMRRVVDPEAFVCTPAIAHCHTEIIEALHRRIPIQTVSDEFMQEEGTEDPVRTIRGLEHALDAAFEQASMFSELGCEWASPPAALA